MSDGKGDPLLRRNSNGNNQSDYTQNEIVREDDWWTVGDSSSSSDYSSQSERSKADWENYVNCRGELFYYESLSKENAYEANPIVSSPEKAIPSYGDRKATPGTLIRLIRRRSSSRRSFKRKELEENGTNKNSEEIPTVQSNSISSLNETKETYKYEVTLCVDPHNKYNFGRRATALETFLGLVTIIDNEQVIVSGFSKSFNKPIKGKINIGDFLHSINGILITPRTVDSFLETITTPQEVKLIVQNYEIRQPGFQSKEDIFFDIKESENKLLGLGVIYAKLDGLSEGGPPEQGIIYSYPTSTNPLCLIRGSFITLHHLLPDVAGDHPVSTTVNLGGIQFHIVYSHEKKEVMLLSLPKSRYKQKEAIRVTSDLGRCLCFMFQSLSRCFGIQGNKNFLDDFFEKFFSKTIEGDLLEGIGYANEFEDILPACRCLCLPKEPLMHINDALNELESNDISSFENERLYSIIGSAFYYKGYMICSHLNKEDVIDISSLLRNHTLMNLNQKGVKELVFWKEVYPSSCQRGSSHYSSHSYSTPHGRWFLLIVGQCFDMLAVLLEAGGCTARIDGNPGPNILYVEEAQATLDHIRKIGISCFISKWLQANDLTSEAWFDLNSESLISNTLDRSKSSQSISSVKTVDSGPGSQTHVPSSFEANSSTVLLDVDDHYKSINTTENGPVLGRRAERERLIEGNSLSEVSDDSDWMKDQRSVDGGSSFNMTEFTSLLGENFFQSKFISGPSGVLLHYVHLDTSEGIFLSSTSSDNPPSNFANILHNFRQIAHQIHHLLKNTICFKKMKVQDITSNIVNKSLVAIKEHGVLFEVPRRTDDKESKMPYWVVGRLFFVPHPREVYVCYHDSCPQNMVEIAFRLALNISN